MVFMDSLVSILFIGSILQFSLVLQVALVYVSVKMACSKTAATGTADIIVVLMILYQGK